MSKRSATSLETNHESTLKKRKLCISQTHNSTNTVDSLSTNEVSNCNNNKLINTRELFLQSQRKWIQYPKHINNQVAWNKYSLNMENSYNSSFPDLNEFKIGNLITFRKNSQFEFMSGIIIRGQNTNQSSIYSNSNKQICIKLLPDALSTQTINAQLCSINKSNLNTFNLINNETDIYSLIPKQTFEFEYSESNNNNNNNNNNNFLFTQQKNNQNNKRKIHKKEMKFETEIILINILEYEIFEHREIVWSQIEGFEWHPSQILFKWKYGHKISPSMAKQQFGLLYVLVAFFDVNQTSKIRLSQRHLISFHNEPNLDIINRSKKDYKKFNIVNNSIHNAIILASLQKEINYKLHYIYHNNIHMKNVWKLRNLYILNYDWIAQKIFILNEEKKIWITARIMYYSHVLNKHFIQYDDDGYVEWINMNDNNVYIDWCSDGYNVDCNDNTIHEIREIHGYGVDECTTNKVAISTRLIGGIYKNCNKCWICNELVLMNLNEIECIHCICCRRRGHLNCLRKSGVNKNILINHLLSIHCDECRNCVLCKKQLAPHNIIEWTLNIFDINKFMSNCFSNKNSLYYQSIMQCNLCKRHFHKKCLPQIDININKLNINCVPKNNNNNKNNNKMQKWLCFDCRICRCCNNKISNGEWYDGYTLCFKCHTNQNKICKICYKNNWNNIIHEPFLIQCHKCNDYIHLSCSPYKLDEILIMKFKNIETNFICHFCMEKTIQKMQFNVIEILIKNDGAGIVIRNIDTILVIRSYILSSRVTLIEFINLFKKIWNIDKYDINVVNKMMDYLCEIVAKLFNHFCLINIKSLTKKCIDVIRKNNNNNNMTMNKCVYYSSNESLLLLDKCICCGSCQDKHKLIICKRCSITVHNYCIRLNINFKISDNIGYCYDCLWFYYKNNKLNKIAKSIKLLNGNKNKNKKNEEWKLMGIHLKALYELLDNNELNNDSFNEFILSYGIPLYIKPLLCNIINDTQYCDNKQNRQTTKVLSLNELRDPIGVTPTLNELAIIENEYKSELYLSLNNKDNKIILNDNRKCELCNYHINDIYNESKICGRLLPVQQLLNDENNNEYECKWIHIKCALSSTDYTIEYFNTYGTNIININMSNVLYICKEYKCHICNQFGASIHCSISDCTFSYHYPCIITTQMYENWNYNSKPFFCNMHKIHYNNHTNIINQIRNKNNLYDKCCINLYNDYINDNNNNNNECFKVKGNVIFKKLKDRNNNVILYQIYDMFWSYCNIGKRTQFIYETYKCNNKYKYKLIVSDDPMSYQILNGNDSKQILQKLIQKYPNGFDKSLFDEKHSFFL